MTKTKNAESSPSKHAAPDAAKISQAEPATADFMAFLYVELAIQDFEEGEAFLRSKDGLSQEAAQIRRIADELSQIGSGILSEAVPDNLLKLFLKLPR